MTLIGNPDETIAKSRRALAAWDWMSMISQRPDEVVRLLHDEARMLETLALEHPDRAVAAAQLIAAFEKLSGAIERGEKRYDS